MWDVHFNPHYYCVNSSNFSHIHLFNAPFLRNLWDDWHNQPRNYNKTEERPQQYDHLLEKEKTKEFCKHFPYELIKKVH